MSKYDAYWLIICIIGIVAGMLIVAWEEGFRISMVEVRMWVGSMIAICFATALLARCCAISGS